MKRSLLSFAVVLSFLSFARAAEPPPGPIPNPHINYDAFLQKAEEVAELRQKRRITEGQFLTLIALPDTVILDARSAEKYSLLHIKGARNLSLPDMTEEELSKVIPSKDTRALIYCNNNFENAPEAFAAKTASASLNIYTFNTLHSYGYTNVYELGPFINIRISRLPFEGSQRKTN